MKPFLLILILQVLAGCTENLPFPSGKLQGNLSPVPDDWTRVAAAQVVQLETKPSKPYSVNLWIIGFDDRLFVHAGDNRARWVENILANPDVRLLIGDRLFELVAIRVVAQSEFDEFALDYKTKYGSRPRNENVNEAYLFRLKPRP